MLSRIDALSARPHTDPEGFMRLLGAKRHEVAERLEMRGMPIHGDCPLPVAADPGGRRAHKPTWVLDDFSNSKGWDGIADLIDVIKRLAAAGLDHAAIDRTVSELVKAKAELESKAGLEDRSVRECDRLISIYTVAGKRFERLLDSARTRLASIIDEEIAKRLGDLSDFPTAKLEEIKASPEKWIITADLSDALDEWRKWVATSVASINDELGREIEARIESRAFAEAKKSGALDGLAADLIKGLVGLAGEAAGRAGQEAAEQAAANAVRLIANQIPELAPYAGQLGARLAQGVGAAAGVLVEGVLQTYDEVKQREREKDLADLATTLHSAGAEWVTGVIEGIGDTPGILDAVVKETTELINGGLEELTDRRDRVAAYSGSLVSSAAAADDLIHLGRECSIAS